MNTQLSEALNRIEVRQEAKKAPILSPKWRLDGYQMGLLPDTGCWNITILAKKSPARGATICLEGPENERPTDEAVEKAILNKERQFLEGRKSD